MTFVDELKEALRNAVSLLPDRPDDPVLIVMRGEAERLLNTNENESIPVIGIVPDHIFPHGKDEEYR